VLLFGAPSQLGSVAGLEHGRTIPSPEERAVIRALSSEACPRT
jgi:hypothetical protein